MQVRLIDQIPAPKRFIPVQRTVRGGLLPLSRAFNRIRTGKDSKPILLRFLQGLRGSTRHDDIEPGSRDFAEMFRRNIVKPNWELLRNVRASRKQYGNDANAEKRADSRQEAWHWFLF